MTPPRATAATFETSNGAIIHRFTLEAFPNFWVYAYLLIKDEYRILIDCGSGTEPSHENLLDGLSQLKLQPSDLTHILLTHAHIDHYGGLSQLKLLTKAKIGCHELDVSTVSDSESQTESMIGRLESFLTDSGLTKETIDLLLSIYRFTKSAYRSVPVDLTYEANKMNVGPLEMLHLPGHCAGHVAMRIEDVVFCGDMVVEGVTPHLYPESISPYNGLDHYLNSLEMLQTWAKSSRLILNGHDDVITNLPSHIDATHKNLIRRMSAAVGALQNPCTTAEVCDAVYGETDGYQKLLVIEKTGAYIEYFQRHNMVEITNAEQMEPGLPVKYRRTREIPDEEILLNPKSSMVE